MFDLLVPIRKVVGVWICAKSRRELAAKSTLNVSAIVNFKI